MKSPLPLLAVLALAACNPNNQPAAVATDGADANAAVANVAPVELPPAMRSQKTYRCKDNSLAFVTWYVGDKFADAKIDEKAAPTRLTSSTGISPWTSAVGWTLAGNDSEIRLTTPGKGPQDCHT